MDLQRSKRSIPYYDENRDDTDHLQAVCCEVEGIIGTVVHCIGGLLSGAVV